ncbi:methyltransferase [Rhodobacteraceae bacterium]|nr:methyltransferase [Paracoccaceae bacterium]
MFSPDDLSWDDFMGGQLRIAQPRYGYRAAMDPVLLAAACPARTGQSVLELGCGAGVASLCLGRRLGDVALAGLELQPEYAALARMNAQANNLSFDVIEGDLSEMPAELRAQTFNHVIANPPYFAPNNGTKAADRGREKAQREDTPLATWISAGMRRLKPAGWMTLIQNADRLSDILVPLAPLAGNIHILPVAARRGRDAGRVIVLARKGAKAPLRLLAPLVLHNQDRHLQDAEDLSDIAQSVLRFGKELQVVG